MSVFKEAVAKAKSFLFARQQAYQQVFTPESRFAQMVLRDLAKFCRANQSAFNKDERIHAVLEGRREVWLRIERHLKMNPEELWKLIGRSDLE
jgi:HD superfamily phosphohydrolase